ncbi:insulin-induced protein-domain-containing protein [Lipomyces oligophaga]|uniref:insulin-induced protein-domain-containing protein n=1 Tax=Lipomyces oligophaga TaxID=45792 RepID=UPI0034CEAB06
MSTSSNLVQPTPKREFPLSSAIQDVSATAAENESNSGGLGQKSQSTTSLMSSTLVGIFGSNLSDPSRAPTPDISLQDRVSPSPLDHSNTYSSGVARARQLATESNQNSKLRHRRHSSASGSMSFAGDSKKSASRLQFIWRCSLLFSLGVAYGHLLTQLQDNHFVTTTTLDVEPMGSFTLSWGILGLLSGALLPLIDYMLPEVMGPRLSVTNTSEGSATALYPILRAVGVFIGVSYGVRHLPWTSTLQGALTITALNPLLWFMIDTTVNGFLLSSLTAIAGSSCLAWLYPSHLPSSSEWSEDYISVITWIASIFFCGSICFGAIGRKLLGNSTEV